ncbi:hypothetical protein BDZ91DRAFT_794813 [Kalaharituber pfeilii]|nr:hypothetical protein BDZ91DRAFT_794813 [Kalaharituber pfeilii]
MAPESQNWLPRYPDGHWFRCPTFADNAVPKAYSAAMSTLQEGHADRAIRQYITVAAGEKRRTKTAAAPYFGVHYYMKLHLNIIKLIVFLLLTLWGIAFEWTEVYPTSVPKPPQVSAMGTAFKVARFGLYTIFAHIPERGWNTSGGAKASRRLLLGMTIATVVDDVVKNVMIAYLVPNSTIITSRDAFNLMASPLMPVWIFLMEAGSRDDPELPFTRPGELFSCILESPRVGQGLEPREIGILLEALLWRNPRNGKRS